jgi:hypothetical protein
MNPYGSRRRLRACFGRTYRGPSQSITSADLVVAALEHPTPNAQHPTPKHPTPKTWSVLEHPTPNAKVQTPSDQDDAALLEL